MRINYTLWDSRGCGGTRFIFETANILAERGHKVTITSLGKRNKEWFKFNKRIKFIYPEKTIYVPKKGEFPVNILINRIFCELKLPFKINRLKILKKAIPECDINIATYHPTASVVYESGKGKGYSCVQHDETIFVENSKEKQKVRDSFKFNLKPFVVSHWLKDFVEETYQKPTFYVGSATNQKSFTPQNNKEEKTVSAILTGVYWKGDDDLIKAFEIINKKVKGVKFKIVGNKQAAINLLIKNKIKLDNLEFYDFFPGDSFELRDFYSSSTVFVFASHLEGLGVPPLEAMGCKTACVITDCLGIRDFSKNNNNSLVVPIKNPEKIANATVKLLENKKLRNKIEKNATKTAKNWSWEKVVDRMEKLFKETI